jgi:hypothetical protein
MHAQRERYVPSLYYMALQTRRSYTSKTHTVSTDMFIGIKFQVNINQRYKLCSMAFQFRSFLFSSLLFLLPSHIQIPSTALCPQTGLIRFSLHSERPSVPPCETIGKIMLLHYLILRFWIGYCMTKYSELNGIKNFPNLVCF